MESSTRSLLPFNVSADYVDRISKGDIPAKITDTYKGDFNTIKNNLNTCIGECAGGGLVACWRMRLRQRKFETRADPSHRTGNTAR